MRGINQIYFKSLCCSIRYFEHVIKSGSIKISISSNITKFYNFYSWITQTTTDELHRNFRCSVGFAKLQCLRWHHILSYAIMNIGISDDNFISSIRNKWRSNMMGPHFFELNINYIIHSFLWKINDYIKTFLSPALFEKMNLL